jgi:hypothetical protein
MTIECFRRRKRLPFAKEFAAFSVLFVMRAKQEKPGALFCSGQESTLQLHRKEEVDHD